MKTQQHVTIIIDPIRIIHLYAKITEHLKNKAIKGTIIHVRKSTE
jgi:hypothetical protein